MGGRMDKLRGGGGRKVDGVTIKRTCLFLRLAWQREEGGRLWEGWEEQNPHLSRGERQMGI
jgi:hypothetical protein